ncbi:MAG: histidine kinase, partial [Pseudanabaena sp.]
MTSFYAIAICLSLFILLVGFLFFTREGNRRRTEKLLRQQSDRERLVTQIAHQIRQSLNLDEVLTTTVKEVQLFLQADRVLIYRLWDDGTG